MGNYSSTIDKCITWIEDHADFCNRCFFCCDLDDIIFGKKRDSNECSPITNNLHEQFVVDSIFDSDSISDLSNIAVVCEDTNINDEQQNVNTAEVEWTKDNEENDSEDNKVDNEIDNEDNISNDSLTNTVTNTITNTIDTESKVTLGDNKMFYSMVAGEWEEI
jgi:hypothetical protein